MNIDHHTINTLRTLANQCAELEHHAGLEPANLLALLDAFEERDEYRNHLAAIAEMTGNGDDIGAAHEGVNALIEDRARFPDKPDGIGLMISAHIKNKDAAVASAKEYAEKWRIRMDRAERQLAKVEAERDALAAHVEVMSGLWFDMDDCEQGSDEQEELIAKMFDAIRDHHNEPTTSLARRDARLVADALKNLLGIVRCSGNRHLIATVETNIEHLHKRAEGHQ